MSYQNDLEFAKDLALEAGGIMRRYFRAEDIGRTWKHDRSPVTVADLKINSLVIEQVKKHYPEYGVIGEEESYKPDREKIWVVDPIDGTVPFSIGIPTSTFCLAQVDKTDGQPKTAVVFDPFLDNLYWAEYGGGAYLNDIKIKTSSAKTMKSSYVSGGVKNKFANEKFRNLKARNLTFWSYAYEAVKVATGEFTIGVITYGSPWDSAAAALIVQEAGGVATDLEGKKRRYDKFANGGIVAANNDILKEFLK